MEIVKNSRIIIISFAMILVISGITSANVVMIPMDERSEEPDSVNRWIIVDPVPENKIGEANIIPHDDERIVDIEALQKSLKQSEDTGEKVTSSLTTSQNDRFVESTRNIERIPNKPGFYVQYNGKVFQVYNQGLT